MNKYIGLFFVAISTVAPLVNFAQLPKDDETNKIIYKEVVEVQNKTKQQLYNSVKLWMITNYVSGDNPLNYYDDEVGTVIANGRFAVDYNLVGAFRSDWCRFEIKYTINVSTKDGKYRYAITDFTFQLISWSFANSEGIIPINDRTRYALGIPGGDGYIPTPNYKGLYSYNEKARSNALSSFYSNIDGEIKKKILSLSYAIKGGGDDSW